MLQIEDLSVNIGEKRILNRVCATFDSGSITCILGPNGSGKTTLMRAVDGIIKCEGKVIYNDGDVLALPVKERAKIIAFLPQNRPALQIEGGLLIEHGRFPHMSFMKKLGEKDHLAIENAIKLTETEHLVAKPLNKMSGGEQQRIYIACALAQETDVLLLDEPTTHLDLQSQIEILELMKKLKAAGKTVVSVLHDLAQAFSVADKILLMQSGDAVDYGTPQEVIERGNIKSVFGFNLIKDDSPNALYPFKLLNLGEDK